MSGVAPALGELHDRPCPVCGNERRGRVVAESNVDPEALGRFAFASRKQPELMRHRLVECSECDVVYANPAPSAAMLADAYEQADFDSAEEARYAAATYASVVRRLMGRLPGEGGALDIGTGDGAFMVELDRMGFTRVEGVEPSTAPRAAAPDGVRGRIRAGVFAAADFAPRSMRLVTCFQTIEHVPDPLALCRDAAELLVPGGALLVVAHDRRALVNRAMGLRSPIHDVEHLQLFSPASLRRLLSEAGLVGVGGRHIVNRYPLGYWMRLAPVPAGPVERSRVARLPVALPVGNQAVWGFRPRL